MPYDDIMLYNIGTANDLPLYGAMSLYVPMVTNRIHGPQRVGRLTCCLLSLKCQMRIMCITKFALAAYL